MGLVPRDTRASQTRKTWKKSTMSDHLKGKRSISELDDGMEQPSPKYIKDEPDAETFSGAGNNQQSTDRPSASSDANSHEGHAIVNVKLTDLLPPQVPAQKLLVAVDLSEVLIKYLEKSFESYSFSSVGTISELDLTMPSSYLCKLQDTSENLSVIFAIVMAKLIESKVTKVVFPDMRIDLLEAVIRGVMFELGEGLKPQFDVIKLSFSAKEQKPLLHDDLVGVVELLLAYKPKEICFVTDDFDQHKAKKLRDVVHKKVPAGEEKPKVKLQSKLLASQKQTNQTEIKKSSSKSKQKALIGGTTPKEKMLLPKKLILQNQSQVFVFDFHMMVPYSPGSSNFTAYKYWKLDKIHSKGFTGKGITVAIVDSGISPHDAFESRIIPQDFSGDKVTIDKVGHGTMCAGILCGKSFPYYHDPQNESDINPSDFPCGVAPDVTLVVCKVTSGASKTASSFAVAHALHYIRQSEDVDVVCLTMGSLGFSLDVVSAIDELVHNGIIVVCAASNYCHQFSQPICFPARLGHVLCIGSHGPHGKPSSFSPIGQEIDFLAPGENVAAPNSTFIANHVAVDSGTSYAASAVAGLICLILQYISSLGDKFGTEIVKQFKNHWVMKEILRKISTCPGRHTDDEGFGALNPLQFFQRPDHIIQTIHDEVINPVFTELSQD